MSDNKKQLSIPADLYNDIQESIKGKGFSSIDDYVTYIFRVIIGKKSRAVDSTDDEKVMEQLKALGYI